MKALILSVALAALASAASATTVTCERIGHSNNFKCPVGSTTYNVSNANSAAAAAAAAKAYAEQKQSQNQAQVQGQAQGQQQGQTSANDNSNSSSITNTIEGNPKHTTSMNLGVGINFSVPIASGVQTRNAIDAANWFIQNGDRCTAFNIMSKAPRVRSLKINFTCGDKG
jgi:hypothetical protein